MGIVYAAEHSGTGRRVAVKVMNPLLASHDEAVERFFREARAAAALHHPNVVDVIDVGTDDEYTKYLVLEYLDGESLAELLERRTRLSASEVAEIILPILSALDAAHTAGIVHRDIKPDNIFISTNRVGEVIPKLLDFGVAKMSTGAGVTQTGLVLGTPYYMAPEQLRGSGPVTNQADIWALGVVLYESLTGQPPFDGPDTPQILEAIVTTPHKAIEDARPDLPEAYRKVVNRTLEKDPQKRYRTAREVSVDLASAAQMPAPRFTGEASRSTIALPMAPGTRATDPRTVTTTTDPSSYISIPRSSRSNWIPLAGAALIGVAAFGLIWSGGAMRRGDATSSGTAAAANVATVAPTPLPMMAPVAQIRAETPPIAVNPPQPTAVAAIAPSPDAEQTAGIDPAHVPAERNTRPTSHRRASRSRSRSVAVSRPSAEDNRSSASTKRRQGPLRREW